MGVAGGVELVIVHKNGKDVQLKLGMFRGEEIPATKHQIVIIDGSGNEHKTTTTYSV